MGRPPKPEEKPTLNYYGLKELGYGGFPHTGDYLRDQLTIESMCFRIGLRTDEGGLGKFGHYKAIVDLLWNHEEVGSHVRFIWNTWASRMTLKCCEFEEISIAGAASAGKSSPMALWAVVNYITDPTHTLVLVMSTTLAGAKKRIWKNVIEFWEGIPNLPGRLLKSTNEIKGKTYDGVGFGDSSGIYLLASEQSSEKSAMEKLIGIKAPRTGNSGATYEEMIASGEYDDLFDKFDEEHLRDLLPRLQNLSDDRIGTIILIVDEATGCSPSILNVINSNMKPGNSGHLQVIMISNPANRWDTFGMFSTPDEGWDSVTMADDEWTTTTGGICIRFDGEKNPRIVEGNERLSWMLRQKDIDAMEKTYGRNSSYFNRMCKAWFSETGSDEGVYNQSDFISTGAMDSVMWGFKLPVMLSSLDPSFSAGGDRASCTFFKLGLDITGKKTLERIEEISLPVDTEDVHTPISYQLVRKWKAECVKRGVTPENACFDSTGGGITFADVVKVVWSPRVLAISSAGKASKTPVGLEKHPNGEKILCSERYSNRATEIWFGAHPLLRSGQIKGVTVDLGKQICARQHDKSSGRDARVLKIENKRIFKSRVGNSPDESDSFFLGIELAKIRHGLKPVHALADEDDNGTAASGSTDREAWKHLCARARRISGRKRLE